MNPALRNGNGAGVDALWPIAALLVCRNAGYYGRLPCDTATFERHPFICFAMPHLLFWFCSLVWGSSFILMKKAAFVFSPASVGGWRAMAGGLSLALLWWLQGKRRVLPPGAWPKVAVVALLGNIVPHTIQPLLVVRYGSGFIGMTVAFVPLLTVLVSVPMLGVYPSRRQLIGVVGGLGFLALMMADGLDRDMTAPMLVLALLVPTCYAIGNTFVRQKLQDAPPLPVTALALLLAGGVLVPLSFVEQQVGLPGPPATAASADAAQWRLAVLSLFALGALGTGLATYAFLKLIVLKGPLFAGMVTYLIPIGAILWGAYDGEAITTKQIAALGGVLAMVALVQWPLGARKNRDL